MIYEEYEILFEKWDSGYSIIDVIKAGKYTRYFLSYGITQFGNFDQIDKNKKYVLIKGTIEGDTASTLQINNNSFEYPEMNFERGECKLLWVQDPTNHGNYLLIDIISFNNVMKNRLKNYRCELDDFVDSYNDNYKFIITYGLYDVPTLQGN